MIKDAQGKDSGFEHVMTFGSKGTGDGQFNYPKDFDLTADKKYILVTDTVKANVQAFDRTTGKFVSKFGGKGDANHQLDKPEGISKILFHGCPFRDGDMVGRENERCEKIGVYWDRGDAAFSEGEVS